MKHARKVHKTIKAWVRKGNPNVHHYDLLMNAESSVLSGKLDSANDYYRDVIVSATRQGRIHESAYVSERYGEYLLDERKEPEEAMYHLQSALRRYEEWGAARKVEMLYEKHPRLLEKETPTEVFVSRGSSEEIHKHSL